MGSSELSEDYECVNMCYEGAGVHCARVISMCVCVRATGECVCVSYSRRVQAGTGAAVGHSGIRVSDKSGWREGLLLGVTKTRVWQCVYGGS